VRERSFILVASLVSALIIGAVGAFAYDHTRADTITKGIHVGGVDVGGMTRSEARAAIAGTLSQRLERPVVVKRGSHSFTLKPRAVGATFDVNAMVDSAVARSREGSIVSRVIHELRGDKINVDLPGTITYQRSGVHRFIVNVVHKLNRKPIDASLGFTPNGFDRVAGRDGVSVDERDLSLRVEGALDGSYSGPVAVKVATIHPRVTRQMLAAKYPKLITINRSAFKLRLYKNLKLVKTYSIAVGMQGLETPSGLYPIQNKQVDPTWVVPNSSWAGSLAGTTVPGGTAANPLKARWMGIWNGAGIHGTDNINSLGSAASHGCIRMAVPDVIDLYDRVDVGTPVYIA
jgi:lipoprotein-anchoring transpeptidase ErfK/SrfK